MIFLKQYSHISLFVKKLYSIKKPNFKTLVYRIPSSKTLTPIKQIHLFHHLSRIDPNIVNIYIFSLFINFP